MYVCLKIVAGAERTGAGRGLLVVGDDALDMPHQGGQGRHKSSR